MHRVSAFLPLLMSLSVSCQAGHGEFDEVSETGCPFDRSITYPWSMNDIAGNQGREARQQCFYEAFPILKANVSAEEMIRREIPSPPGNVNNMVGVCFSGGGARSLATSSGEYAALLYLGYESRINYLSMVSGGAWGIANYYALPESVRKKYFGNIIEDLKTLKWADKELEEEQNIAWLHPHNVGSVPQRLGLSGVVWHFVSNFFSQGTKLWNEYLSKALFTPFGLNPHLSLSQSLFSAKPDHMQLIVTAGVEDANGDMVPLEITPVGIGAGVPVNNDGDAYVLPPEGFGRQAHGIRSGHLWVDAGSGFTLGDMHAVTSSNFAHMLPLFWDAMTLLGMGAPSFNWLNINLTSGEIKQHQPQVIDSGRDDYLGLMPLLARGMRKVIAFVNTDIPIVKGEAVIGLEKMLPSYFGVVPDESGQGDTYHFAAPGLEGGCGKFYLKNQVFPDSYYEDLADHLWQAKTAGRPVVYLQKNLPLLNNDKYGVKGGGKVDILWVYNDLPDGWFKRLNIDLQKKIAGSDQFLCRSGICPSGYRFPHYEATTELNLSRVQVNMLFHLQVWTLLSSRGDLKEFFDE